MRYNNSANSKSNYENNYIFRTRNEKCPELTDDQLYTMVSSRALKNYKNRPVKRVRFAEQINPKTQNTQTIQNTWIVNIVVVAIIIFLIYLTFRRYNLAGKSIVSGDTMEGLIILSPEIASLLLM